MPEWDFNTPSSVTAWEEASNVYAEQVSGEIRAVVGSELRPGNIWENIELPRLKANPNVTKTTTIDPKTGVEKNYIREVEMKITGTRSTITFDLENGFLLKAQGELLINKKFVVYKDSMTQWEPPHEDLPITQREIENIINTAKKMESNQTSQLDFV